MAFFEENFGITALLLVFTLKNWCFFSYKFSCIILSIKKASRPYISSLCVVSVRISGIMGGWVSFCELVWSFRPLVRFHWQFLGFSSRPASRVVRNTGSIRAAQSHRLPVEPVQFAWGSEPAPSSLWFHSPTAFFRPPLCCCPCCTAVGPVAEPWGCPRSFSSAPALWSSPWRPWRLSSSCDGSSETRPEWDVNKKN